MHSINREGGRRPSWRIWGSVCCALALAASGNPGRAQPEDGTATVSAELRPAQRRASELLDALNSRDRAVLRSFVEQSFSAEALQERPVEDQVGQLLNVADETRAPTFIRWETAGENEAKIVYRNDLFGRPQSITVKIEPAAPYKILSWTTPKNVPEPVSAPTSDEEVARRLHAFAERMAAHDFFSGVVLISRGDEPILERAYGLAERNFDVPNRTDTKFLLASITKLFTAVAIGQLVEQGKVSLDDTLAKFVPEAAGGDRVRIKHLLSHTSGIGDIATETFHRTHPADMRTIAEVIELADHAPPRFEPGTDWEYNNLGYLYLGRVIEAASGQNYYDYVAENVFSPAEMSSTGFWDLDYVIPKKAYPYERDFGIGTLDYRNMLLLGVVKGMPFGSATGIVGDLKRFAAALRDGTLLRPETLAEFRKVVPGSGRRNWGLGFRTRKLAGSDIVTTGHSGNSVGTCTDFLMFDHRGTPWTIVVLSNSGISACIPLVREASALLVQRLEQP